MVLAMGSFVTNDTIVKLVGQTLPVGEIIMVRGTFAMILILALCIQQGVLSSLPMLRNRYLAVRSSLDLFATILFIMALMHMQIANLTAVMQVVPLAVTLLSAVVLGETVGWRRWSAVMLGFIGVLMIVKPSPATFSIYDVLAVIIVFAVAARDIVTRRIPGRIPTLLIALANASVVCAGGFVLGLFEGFVVPQPWQIALLALAAVFLASGYMFMVATLRAGDLSATAPFRYSIMLFAIVSGIAVFEEIPDWIAVAGMVIIVATGLYSAHREAVTGNARRRAS